MTTVKVKFYINQSNFMTRNLPGHIPMREAKEIALKTLKGHYLTTDNQYQKAAWWATFEIWSNSKEEYILHEQLTLHLNDYLLKAGDKFKSKENGKWHMVEKVRADVQMIFDSDGEVFYIDDPFSREFEPY